ncbi:hypothetical protein [Sorangium sp. So ce861]|uniref:hypothetical protein n=1 Tax=Sorangium sp. So ce861 TaxID=3133323 RepID=UPI003F615782
MTITWRPPTKRSRVERILHDHPAHSSRCDEAAKAIWPLAREQDDDAGFWLLRAAPWCGPLLMIQKGLIGILPKGIPDPPKWTHHICVATEKHCVCALTGADGFPEERYLAEKFQYAEDVHTTRVAGCSELDESLATLRAGSSA